MSGPNTPETPEVPDESEDVSRQPTEKMPAQGSVNGYPDGLFDEAVRRGYQVDTEAPTDPSIPVPDNYDPTYGIYTGPTQGLDDRTQPGVEQQETAKMPAQGAEQPQQPSLDEELDEREQRLRDMDDFFRNNPAPSPHTDEE